MKLHLSAELAARIAGHLQDIAAGRENLPERVHKEIALRVGAFPVMYGWGGRFAVRPDGQVLTWSAEGDDIRDDEELSPFSLTVVLADATKQYPEFGELLPQRPDDAVTCNGCNGSGLMWKAVVCSMCAKLGWTSATVKIDGTQAEVPEVFRKP